MTKPIVVQVISCTVAPTAPRSCGMATLTMDESMAPISVPNVTDIVTSAPGPTKTRQARAPSLPTG
jgi:hypothetical protein